MKQSIKRVLLVLFMAVGLFALSACSSDEVTAADPQEDFLKQQVVAILDDMTSIPVDQIDLFIQQNGAEGAQSMVTGLENYKKAVSEYGSYVLSGDGTVSATEDGFKIIINTQFEKRDVTFEVMVEESSGGEGLFITSITFNPVYTMAEKMEKAFLNTLMGMGTVFCVLIFISFIIGGFRFIHAWETKRESKKKGVDAPAEAPSVPAAENLIDDLELVAVITAAVAASENTVTEGLVVRSIRRASTGKWKRA